MWDSFFLSNDASLRNIITHVITNERFWLWHENYCDLSLVRRKTCLQKRPSTTKWKPDSFLTGHHSINFFFNNHVSTQHLNLHNSGTRGFFKIKINEKSNVAVFLFFKKAELKKKILWKNRQKSSNEDRACFLIALTWTNLF